ncbi:MAG: PA2779 family protein [Thermodesulfovibrionales bacterium]|nr:PA2779 family protein [Thermodesulfovibrionales bacterium]
MPFIKQISWYLVIAMFLIGIAPKVDAGFAPSEIIALSQMERTADLQKIQNILEAKAVKERLSQLGFTHDEIQQRFSQLNDQQMHQIALQLDDLKVGQDGLGVVIALLVIAILIVVLLKLTGHKVIVTK